jgi:NADH:ubiquinone oxidoreductase subunit 3 (subunit A)
MQPQPSVQLCHVARGCGETVSAQHKFAVPILLLVLFEVESLTFIRIEQGIHDLASTSFTTMASLSVSGYARPLA